MPVHLSPDQLHAMARLGATQRIQELEAEITAIRTTFLGGSAKRAATATSPERAVKRRRSRMNAAQRKAVSERMKRYWADRRKKG